MRIGQILDALDRIAPPEMALDNDPRGLLLGDPSAATERLAVALDVTAEVAREAGAWGAGLVIAHHPLIYHPLKTIRADEPHPGAVVLACLRAGIAVACAHTNWDVAPGGVNDILARLLGLTQVRPLRTTYQEPLAKIAVFVPAGYREAVLDAMAAAGAGAIGDYDRCAFWTPGTGTFRPLPGARPFVGAIGAAETVAEERLEMIVPARRAQATVAAMRAAHPYEEVAYDLYPLTNPGSSAGIGRIGTLPAPVPREAFLATVRAALSFDAVRASGGPERIARVAVCGGAGAELLPEARRAGADALVTADVRHHEFVAAEAAGIALVDAGHASTETPGARELARRLAEALPAVTVRFLPEPDPSRS